VFSTIQSLSDIGHLGESIEIRACARDSRSSMDPENALCGPNAQNPAKPIRARFGWVHGSSPKIRLLIEPSNRPDPAL
jgi:hypothetical protein